MAGTNIATADLLVRTCRADGCDKPVRKTGLCAAHYTHKRRHGDENAPFAYHWAPERLCAVCGAKDWPENGLRVVCSFNCHMRRRTIRTRMGADFGAYPTERDCSRCGISIDLMGAGKAGRKRRVDTLICQACRNARYTRHKMSVTILLQRDGPDCGICGALIDFTLVGTRENDRPSIDHIHPWALGGTNDPDNLQLAHLSCNQKKHAYLNYSPLVGQRGVSPWPE